MVCGMSLMTLGRVNSKALTKIPVKNYTSLSNKCLSAYIPGIGYQSAVTKTALHWGEHVPHPHYHSIIHFALLCPLAHHSQCCLSFCFLFCLLIPLWLNRRMCFRHGSEENSARPRKWYLCLYWSNTSVFEDTYSDPSNLEGAQGNVLEAWSFRRSVK